MFVFLAACGAAAAPSGRVAYVVTAKDDSAAARARLHAALVIAAAAADDVLGDGFVVRLDGAARARIAALAEVGAIVPLPIDARLGPLPAGAGVVHVDLFDDATAAEGEAIAAWIGAHGGAVRARGATWIDATLAPAAARELAAQASVRWIEAR
jgi:hypothetical protein